MEITPQEALDCFTSDDLIGIGMEADAVRRTLHPDNVVTYSVPRTISVELDSDELFAEIEEAVLAGETTVCFTRHAERQATVAELEETLAAVSERFPSLRLHALSTSEVIALQKASRLTAPDIFGRLRAAGLDSISGDDLSPAEASGSVPLEPWLEVHRAAHLAGLRSTSGLVFGLGEDSASRVDHLVAIRALQAETNGFNAFTLVKSRPPGADPREDPTAVEYLRTLAIARMVLDNVPSIESDCMSHGLKVIQMALRFGANDAGSIAAREVAAPKAAFTEEDLRRVIRDAGFIPAERDSLYTTLFLNN